MKRSRNEELQNSILATIHDDLKRVEESLLQLVESESSFIYQISYQLLRSGGKRLRPALVLLSGKFFDYSFEKVKPVAVAMELVHMATLIHDDIIDEGVMRRGEKTVNSLYGDKIAVLNGDLLFAHGMKFLSLLSDRRILDNMLDIIFAMCIGEVDEIIGNGELNLDISYYLKRIERKTALMFAKSCEFGALICGASKEESKQFAVYGINLGLAFQIMDDLMDLTYSEKELGKTPGEDLRQGIMTLPIILALNTSMDRDLILEVMETKKPDEVLVHKVIESIVDCGAIEETLQVVKEYRERAIQSLTGLPPIPERRSLERLVDFVTEWDLIEQDSISIKKR